jgi:hypothetical protein
VVVLTALKQECQAVLAHLDPDWEGSRLYLTAGGEVSYRDEIRRALHVLRAQSEQLAAQPRRGSFEIYLYRCPPSYHASVADGADPRDGRMTFGAYLFGVPRSQCPVLQLSRRSNPTMFDTYWRSVQALLEAGRRV